MSGHVNDGMDKGSIMDSEDRIEKMVDIYVSAEAVRDMKHKKDKEDTQTTETPKPQQTGSDSVKNRSSRAAVVCLVLLCVLLLTAVIVLCVILLQEGQNKKDREQLILKNTNLTNERDQLILKNTNLTNERDQLILKNTNLTNERDQLIRKNTNLTNERDQLILKNTNLTNERDQLILKNTNLTNQRNQLRNQLQICVEWTCFQSSFYYMSNETKNWTESKRYCTERGADLIIINNRNEKDFVHNMSSSSVFYIGLTDINVEGNWRWVDGTYLNSSFSFWAPGEPNGQTKDVPDEDCVVTVAVPQLPDWPGLEGWLDVKCDRGFKWICEKQISQFILP